MLIQASCLYATLKSTTRINIAKSSAIGNVRIIDNAVTQTKPVKPKKIILL
jgi:tyrosine-protein kinase Etk/Wzc